ncbi:MAG: UDP-N-acetylmuramoyl-L-alanine--D-glutamate ligase [Desulfofustis sp. PB-SRB1]|jgi:UDP-N-acetylmuramoylalanine--D-glutamate ligase|nr:UDP-N-acetylmuramoyl-L-alanine--D-glutamate ligase [Desulfofustis sp. PB-SRB1]MBM1001934.1 UDP-N-acetylmuramoyl-L-alanine--D-glutamate ligase [Desulfofustis sp. PB-SRB1]HBH28022.1 UDP-N-acetylmuramoyl-L-alanine--D-glutamate ligase [Desulfofustis sp.]HBH31476.1 UDP-N-acetylmuramoyl-L-alanine--D-glutamate ligase [Desulfofustis sp.]
MTAPITLYSGMTVGMVGFGRANRSLARYLAGCGVRLLVSEKTAETALSPEQLACLADCEARFEGGGHRTAFLQDAELIVVSPGVDPRHPTLQAARAGGALLCGELAIAAGRFEAPVIAVTGTNGKTTVTELIGELLAGEGYRVFVGGNIGTPVGEYLAAPSGYDFVVLEVSSFQLETGGEFSADVGVLLNLSPDHLDRHGSMAAYTAAKMRLFSTPHFSGRAVINGDDEMIASCNPLLKGYRPHYFGTSPHCAAQVDKSSVTVGWNGRLVRFDLTGSSLDTLFGAANCAASLLAVSPFCSDADGAAQRIKAFQTGAHRLQRVAVIDGVSYINDSKATNTGAVRAALYEVGGEVGGRVLLLAGGSDKGDDYRVLREPVRKYVSQALLLGESAPQLGRALDDVTTCTYHDNLTAAVKSAAAVARPGDTVLLSPACASFDMFADYTRRGDAFMESVHRLSAQVNNKTNG